jgi:hypothetical protein
MENILDKFTAVQQEGRELFKRKNADYGNAFEKYGTIGVLVRLGDKIMRAQSITSRSVVLVSDEKLRDTLVDLQNYATLAVALLDAQTISTQGSASETDNEKNEDTIITPKEKSTYTRWFPSESKHDIYYTCTRKGDKYNCTCPGFRWRDWCKHTEIIHKDFKKI